MGEFSKSPLSVAREALLVGEAALAEFSNKYSRKDYTQAQLFAVLVMKKFFRTDDRGIVQILREFEELRTTIGLVRVPHPSTLWHAQRRMLKKGDLKPWLPPLSDAPVDEND